MCHPSGKEGWDWGWLTKGQESRILDRSGGSRIFQMSRGHNLKYAPELKMEVEFDPK